MSVFGATFEPIHALLRRSVNFSRLFTHLSEHAAIGKKSFTVQSGMLES
jgi:hypothetical protein